MSRKKSPIADAEWQRLDRLCRVSVPLAFGVVARRFDRTQIPALVEHAVKLRQVVERVKGLAQIRNGASARAAYDLLGWNRAAAAAAAAPADHRWLLRRMAWGEARCLAAIIAAGGDAGELLRYLAEAPEDARLLESDPWHGLLVLADRACQIQRERKGAA